MKKPKVKFLVTVWGEQYIKRFASLALPSFLASGNLPALAAATDLDAIVMTAKDDIALWENHPMSKQLREVCGVRFIAIDDLITTGMYGVTLTLAYARAVISCGKDMVNTHFVFMNADFVLADGSLRGLLKHILDGRAIVVAPSFRVVAEDVEPELLAAVDGATGILAIPPRRLVDLALTHMHPTTVAKTVNQGFCHMTHPNQFYWQIDERTVIGRYYLIFMLCLKPERVITKINSYCDYGFIPEMCPSGDEVALKDSDEFFMLELQARLQESFLLRIGRQSVPKVARSLSEWTTREHCRSARHTLYFHAGDLPPTTERIKYEADRFIAKVERSLSKPRPHKHHYYWASGVKAWRLLRRQERLSDHATEIDDDIPISLLRRLRQFVAGLISFPKSELYSLREKFFHFSKALLLGTPPFVRPLHYDWNDYREARRQFRCILRPKNTKILFVSDGPNPCEAFFPAKDPRIVRINLQQVLTNSNQWKSISRVTFSHCLCYMLRKDVRSVRHVIEHTAPHLSQGGETMIWIHHTGIGSEQGNLSNELSDYISEIVPPLRLSEISVSFSGGSLNHFIRRGVRVLSSSLYRNGLLSSVFIVPAIGFLLVLSGLNNLYSVLAMRSDDHIDYCSSILIRISNSRHEQNVSRTREVEVTSENQPLG